MTNCLKFFDIVFCASKGENCSYNKSIIGKKVSWIEREREKEKKKGER